jgi:putative copper export protein
MNILPTPALPVAILLLSDTIAGHGAVQHRAVAPEAVTWSWPTGPCAVPFAVPFSLLLSQGMELYSTVLWHVKRDMTQAHLSLCCALCCLTNAAAGHGAVQYCAVAPEA